jgi:hypothetical protein
MLTTFELYICTVFIVVLFAEFWNVPSMIKRLFKLKQTAFIGPLDCLPCFSFWVSALTFNPMVAMMTFITFYLIDKIIYK